MSRIGVGTGSNSGSATDQIQSSAGLLTPKFVALNASTFGNTTVVTAVASKQIRVINGLLMAASSVGVIFKSAGGTALTGELDVGINGGFQIPYAPTGNFQTVAGEGLVITLNDTVSVGGWLVYIEV